MPNLALRLLFYETKSQEDERLTCEEVIMDWMLLIIGTVTALLGILSIHLMWRGQKHTSQSPFKPIDRLKTTQKTTPR